jgi:ribosomal protein S18 acetylase RimI-like enzyme
MAMRIRLANASDLVEITACQDRAFNLSARSIDIGSFSQNEELALQVQEGDIRVMSDAGRMLGYISFAPNFNHLFVRAIAVLPKYRHRGVGSRLLAFAEKVALQLDLRSVRLFTDGRIAENLVFYQRRGYHVTDRCDEGEFSRVFYRKASR